MTECPCFIFLQVSGLIEADGFPHLLQGSTYCEGFFFFFPGWTIWRKFQVPHRYVVGNGGPHKAMEIVLGTPCTLQSSLWDSLNLKLWLPPSHFALLLMLINYQEKKCHYSEMKMGDRLLIYSASREENIWNLENSLGHFWLISYMVIIMNRQFKQSQFDESMLIKGS